jgi:hypothetical protein
MTFECYRLQISRDGIPSLRTWLNSRKEIRAISAGPAQQKRQFSVDELPLAALEEADGLHLPATVRGRFSGSDSTTLLTMQRFLTIRSSFLDGLCRQL